MSIDHRKDNVRYIVRALIANGIEKKTIGPAIGTVTTTIGRWLRQQTRPNTDEIIKLAKRTLITVDDIDQLTPDEFSAKYKTVHWNDGIGDSQKLTSSSMTFGCISRTPDSINRVFVRHRGSYFMYTRRMEVDGQRMNVHLLTIEDYSDHGVNFTLDRRYDGGDMREKVKGAVFRTYRGLVFDINGFLHFFGEDAEEKDMTTLITNRLDEREPDQMVEGRMVSVKRSGRKPGVSAWKVALVLFNKGIVARETVRDYLQPRPSLSAFPKDVQSIISPVFGR